VAIRLVMFWFVSVILKMVRLRQAIKEVDIYG